jgi:hypothetical protein
MHRAKRPPSTSNPALHRDGPPDGAAVPPKGEMDFFKTLLDSAAARESTPEVRAPVAPARHSRLMNSAGEATVCGDYSRPHQPVHQPPRWCSCAGQNTYPCIQIHCGGGATSSYESYARIVCSGQAA